MKRAQKLLVGLLVLGVLAGAAGPARADAPGPYYATPSWDQTLPSATRFIVLSNLGSAAVLDRETGLVWEKVPDGTNTYAWEDAQFHCNQLTTGNRMGWRLPTLQELASLLDPSVAPPGPTLPAGHPFSNVQSYFYWSATTYARATSNAWFAYLHGANVDPNDKTIPYYAWCVRGGHGVDPQ